MLSVIKVILIIAAVILTTANRTYALVPVTSVTSTATEYMFLTV